MVNEDQQSTQNSSNEGGDEGRGAKQHHHVRLVEADDHDPLGASRINNEERGEDEQNSDQSNKVPSKTTSIKEEKDQNEAAVQPSSSTSKNKKTNFVKDLKLPSFIAWIPPVVTSWSKMKPVLRSGLAAWICMVFLLITPVRNVLGNADFLILVGIFIQPAELPLVAIVEREFFTLLLTCTCWAYANLAIFFAHLAREHKVSAADTEIRLVFTGAYIETAPTAICTTFLAVGAALTLYLKVKFGPSPFIFATILGCICLDITLVYAPLYPYPVYILGKTVVLPLAIKAGVVILVSIFFFPKSVNSAFIERLLGILQPLEGNSEELQKELKKSPLDKDFNFELVRDKVLASEAGLLPLQGLTRLLLREVSFSLASGEDLKGLEQAARRLLAPADGIAFYFTLVQSDVQGIDIMNHPNQAFVSQFITPSTTRPPSPLHSRPATPSGEHKTSSPLASRPITPQLEENVDPVQHRFKATTDTVLTKDHTIDSSTLDSSLRAPSATKARHRFPSKLPGAGLIHPTPSFHSIELRKRLHDLTHRQREVVEVGLWESIRYTAFETQFHGRENDHISEMCMQIMAEASEDLLKMQTKIFADICKWLTSINGKRTGKLIDLFTLRSTKLKDTFLSNPDGSPRLVSDAIKELEEEIEKFKTKKDRILKPFRSSVDPSVEGEKLPHRYLFQSLTYCHFQIVYSQRIVEFLQKLESIEKNRLYYRFWLPTLPTLFRLEAWQAQGGDHEGDHDEDPEEVPGMISTIGQTRARDPDAMNTDSRFQEFGIKFSKFIHSIYRGNSLFMIKVAATTALVALPSVVSSSAEWAYENKAIWVIIMAQLCAARHRGEVLFGFFSRVIATFLGAVGGMLIWYIAAGRGIPNPYAFAVVTAIAFPIVMMIRIHFPGPPITTIITTVTVALVVGYSWKDSKDPTFGSPGIGFEIAWRRFVEVVIGAAAAYIMSLLPPSSSMRTYFRLSHATVIRETGGLFCENIYLASSTKQHHETKEILMKLLAVRQKIRRVGVMKASIGYEWSLRGKWPVHRYEILERTELRILRLLTHAVTIYESLGPAYSRALLKRTRFLDPSFLADCIAVLSMCTTSLSTGQPLPQIAPILIDRYMYKPWGFKIYDRAGLSIPATNEALYTPEEEGLLSQLPSNVTFETLYDEQYQTFAVGASVAFGIIVHLDKLCVAVKRLVGETYAVPADLRTYHPYSATFSVKQ